MQEKDEVRHQISILLFLGLACGVFMFFFTRILGERALTGTKTSVVIMDRWSLTPNGYL